MTKEEMISKFYKKDDPEDNYKEAQRRIREAMERGEKYIFLPGKEASEDEFTWTATPETISKLRTDGFDIDKVWQPCEYWSIEWY